MPGGPAVPAGETLKARACPARLRSRPGEALLRAGLDRVLARRDRDDRLVDLAEVVDQLGPLIGLEDAARHRRELLVGAVELGVGDLDAVRVVGQLDRGRLP